MMWKGHVPRPAVDNYHRAKFDQGKPDLTLPPFEAIEAVTRVMEFGLAKGYVRDSWRDVPDAQRRYMAALLRHVSAILQGEDIDPDSGLPHIDHAACDALFLSALRRGCREVSP